MITERRERPALTLHEGFGVFVGQEWARGTRGSWGLSHAEGSGLVLWGRDGTLLLLWCSSEDSRVSLPRAGEVWERAVWVLEVQI